MAFKQHLFLRVLEAGKSGFRKPESPGLERPGFWSLSFLLCPYVVEGQGGSLRFFLRRFYTSLPRVPSVKVEENMQRTRLFWVRIGRRVPLLDTRTLGPSFPGVPISPTL